MPEETKRGPFWIFGRVALVVAAGAAIAALVLVPRTITDRGPLAIAYIKQWQASGPNTDQHVLEHYKFIVKNTGSGRFIRAIPVDPRQKSFYAEGSGPIHYSPGTQAANAESPTIN